MNFDFIFLGCWAIAFLLLGAIYHGMWSWLRSSTGADKREAEAIAERMIQCHDCPSPEKFPCEIRRRFDSESI